MNDAPPLLPHKLLTTLLHHHFERDDTRIAKDASKLVGKYVEVFVKEAIARAGFERQEAGADGEAGFLEVGFSFYFLLFSRGPQAGKGGFITHFHE